MTPQRLLIASNECFVSRLTNYELDPPLGVLHPRAPGPERGGAAGVSVKAWRAFDHHGRYLERTTFVAEASMPVSLEERYKIAFEAMKAAAEFRVQVVTGWGILLGTVAALFVWVSTNHQHWTWVASLLGAAITILMWLTDWRHRPAIKRAKLVGEAIEKDPAAEIPASQRYLSNLDRAVSHSRMIDVVALLLLGLFVMSTIYLCRNQGRLPGAPPPTTATTLAPP
jgi:hypothetical protein